MYNYVLSLPESSGASPRCDWPQPLTAAGDA